MSDMPPPPQGGSVPPPVTPPPVPPAPPAPPAGGPPQSVAAVPPPAGPASANNGMAIAALILGILSFFCLGPLGGVLAIVFGILGLKKANESAGRGKGMAVAGMVLGIVGTIVSIILLVVFVFAADNASDSIDDWTGKADSSDYRLTVEKCETDSLGYPVMSGVIKNLTNSDKSYTFDYEFRDGKGNLLDSGTSFPEEIPKNDTVKWSIDSFTSVDSGTIKCEITEVNNWFN